MGVEITDENFKSEILDYNGLALVDVSAEWCGPCKILSPIVKELADSMKDTLKVGEADIDVNMTVAQTYGIQAVPTLLLFKNGELVDKRVGVMMLPQLQEWVNDHAD